MRVYSLWWPKHRGRCAEHNAVLGADGCGGRLRSWPMAAFLIVESNTVSGCEKLPSRSATGWGILLLIHYHITTHSYLILYQFIAYEIATQY